MEVKRERKEAEIGRWEGKIIERGSWEKIPLIFADLTIVSSVKSVVSPLKFDQLSGRLLVYMQCLYCECIKIAVEHGIGVHNSGGQNLLT